MSALDKLKLITATSKKTLTPVQHRRSKLAIKVEEQIELAKALRDNTPFTATRRKTVVDAESGVKKSVDAAKRVKPWWSIGATGKLELTVRYGSKEILLSPKSRANAVELADMSALIDTLALIKQAVEAGDLDAQIEMAALQLRSGFERKPT